VHIPGITLLYVGLAFGLLVVPRALQRFHIPAQLTCFVFGIVAAIYITHLVGDEVSRVVATLGIASLFLLAGLEVDFVEIRRQASRLSTHLGLRILFLVGLAWVAQRYARIGWQAAILLGLGLLTPSTGFILGALPTSGLAPAEQAEVSLNAINGEVTALLVLFVVSQAGSMAGLAISTGILIALIVLTPFLFLFLGKYVMPYAPGSEFSLLMMVGILCAAVTQHLGVHYLIGAFVAGLVASLLRTRMASLASEENLNAVRLFASFFIPFYFFHEGLNVPASALGPQAVLGGLALSAVVIPIRVAKIWLEARFLSHRSARGAFRVSVALTPTLIFTLVIAEMLREMFHVSDALYGSLLLYAAVTTILPSFVLPRLLDPVEVATPVLEASG
jgi:Kef-type K+ transport system membrane component KefB